MTRSGASAVADAKRVMPGLILVGVNAIASCAAALMLLNSDTLPFAMAAHGAMMIVAWGCLLPLGGFVARYFKVTPSQPFPDVVETSFWWNWHRGLQYGGVALATGAAGVILGIVGPHVETTHGWCGLVVMIVAWIQLASPLFRGSKGGPTGRGARAADPSSWRGDHYDMTTRRRLFEAWHKPAGWCLLVAAQVTIVLGVDLAGAATGLSVLLAIMMAAVLLALLDAHLRGRWVDTHAALWGPDARGAQADGPEGHEP